MAPFLANFVLSIDLQHFLIKRTTRKNLKALQSNVFRFFLGLVLIAKRCKLCHKFLNKMLNKTKLSSWLQMILIFRGLSSEQLMPLAQIAQLQKFQKGEMIFFQDSVATGFFAVQTGRVKVFKMASNGKEQILHLLNICDYFAEVPALDGKAFPASAIALEYTELIFFPRLPFLDLLHQYPAITINMLMSLANHARKLAHMVEELSCKDVPQRLASYLLDLSDRKNQANVITLDVTKTQLAATLGTIPATLSRALYRLSHEGLIAINGSQIELLDRDRLQDASDYRHEA